MIYALVFLIGFGFSVSGGMSLILYLNFIPAGLHFFDYIGIIQSRMECYFFIIGIVLMGFSIQRLTVISVK